LSWQSADDEPRRTLGGELVAELRAIADARTGLSNRFLVLCDWLLDQSERPAGRVLVALLALTGVWLLL